MKLTRYTDYAMRVMIHLATHDGELSSIAGISRVYGLSHPSLMKVVQDLGGAGYVETVRGRHGGVRLGRPADRINLGELVRHTEAGFALVDCQDCLIAPACGLPGILAEATRGFLSVLDRYTVADLIPRHAALRELFATAPARPQS